jgi:hypothetical protein
MTCCLEKIRRDPEAFDHLAYGRDDALAELAESHPSLMATQMLRAAAKRSLTGFQAGRDGGMGAWMGRASSPKRLARALPTACAVAVGTAQARIDLERGGTDDQRLVARLVEHVDANLTDLWRNLAHLTVTQSDLAAAGLREQIDKHAERHPSAWAKSLEWLLVTGDELDGCDAAVTIALAQTHAGVRHALNRCADSDVLPIRQRAQGILAHISRGGPLEAQLLASLSATLDACRDTFPRPLSEPSSTWMADKELENSLRSTTRAALGDFTDYVATCGGLEEELLTATLLQQLVQHFADTMALTRWMSPASPEVVMASRQVTKTEESSTGADLGVVVDVQASDVTTRIGDLVQVKKPYALIPSRNSNREVWTIERKQLTLLLNRSATAVYWLLRTDGTPLVVPAKYLAALGVRSKSGKTFTVDYITVRHAAVDLPSYLTDLVIGLWLGSSDEQVLAAAEGTAPRQRPRHVLAITVTLPRLIDERPRHRRDRS